MMTTFFAKTSKNIPTKAIKLSALTVSMLLMQASIVQSAVSANTPNTNLATNNQTSPTNTNTHTTFSTIDNVANASYNVGSINIPTQSNSVRVQVAKQYGVEITPRRLVIAQAGDTVQWQNTIVNTSNIAETVVLTYDQPKTLSNFEIYQDLNKNGIIDPSDVLLPKQIRLDKQEQIDIIVQALTNTTLLHGQEVDVKLGVHVVEDPSVKDETVDTVRIIRPQINFKTPDYSKNLNSDEVGKVVHVEALFAGCNLDPNRKDQVWVTISNPHTRDSYSLKAIETGNNTGIYRLKAKTENNANGNPNDDVIQTLNGNQLTATLEACINPNLGLDDNPTPNDLNQINNKVFTTMVMVNNSPKLQIQKKGDVKQAEFGDYVNYTINIKNNGDVPVYDVSLKDALPTGFKYISGSVRVDGRPLAEFKTDGKYQVLNTGELAVGETKEVTYKVLVGATALAGDGINRATAEGQDGRGNSVTSREAQWKVTVGRGAINTDGIIVGKVYHDINRDGIQQKEDGELGVAGVRIFMENGNYVVTDPEGKYNFYGISAKTHVLKIDRTTLPPEVELIEQNNRNAGDPASRFVDLKYGELHRADFAVVDGMGDVGLLNERLLERSQKINQQNNALEQAVKSELSLEPTDYTNNNNNVDATGCKTSNSATFDQLLSCDSAIVNPSDDDVSFAKMQVNLISQPQSTPLEEYLKNVASNQVQFINLSDGQQLDSYKQMVQVQAPLGSKFTLYANGKPVAEEKIGKTAEQQKQKVMAFDYYAVDLERGYNTLKGVAQDVNGRVVSEQSIQVVTPESLQTIDYRTQKNLVPADGTSQYQVVISLKDVDGRPYTAPTPITLDTNIGSIDIKDENPDQAGIQTYVSGSELLIPIIAPNHSGKGHLQISAGSSQQKIPLQFTPKLRPLIAVGVLEGNIALNNFDTKNITDAQDAFEQELQEISGIDKPKTKGRAAFFLKGKVKGEYLLTLAYDSDKKGQRLFRDIQPDEYYPVYGDSSAKGFDAQSTGKLYVRLDKGRSFVMYGDIKTQIDDDEGINLGQYNRTLTGVKTHYEDDDTRVTLFASETQSIQSTKETRGLGISGPYPIAENFNDVVENSESVEVITRDKNNPGIILKREYLNRFSDYEIDPISHSLYLTTPIASQDFDGNPIYLRVTVEVNDGGKKYWVGGIAAKQQLTDKVSLGGTYVKSENPLNKEELASINSVVLLNKKLKLVAEYARNKASNPNYDVNNQINVESLAGQGKEGDAIKVELNYIDDKTRSKAYYQQADKDFVTASSPIVAGRKEAGANISHRFKGDKTTVKLEATHTQEQQTNAKREGIKASIERKLTKNITGEIGVRHYQETGKPVSTDYHQPTTTVTLGSDTFSNDKLINQSVTTARATTDKNISGTTVQAKLSATLPQLNHSKISAEYEQDIENRHRNATSIGAETRLGTAGRLYARHDIINNLAGSYGLDNTDERRRTIVGVDANYMKDGKVYSEYRSRDAISARDAEAAIGLKNKWQIKKGLNVNTLVERIESLSNKDNTSTAVGLGAEYLANEDYKLSGRVEKRWGKANDTFMGSAGIAYRYSDDVTLLAKNIYSEVKYQNNDDYRTMNRFQVGAAYRDYDSNKLDLLTKLEYRLDDNHTGTSPYKKDTYIWAVSNNYHPTRPLTLSGHYAGKYSNHKTSDINTHNTAHAVSGRAMYDINERWDAGVQVGAYLNDANKDVTYLAGAEVGVNPMANLWLSLGYNFMGYRDDDIANDNTTEQGGYLRLRFKFDEDLFKRNDARKNKKLVARKEPIQTR